MFQFIKNKIKSFILKKAAANKMIDIVEVRTKDIGLTQVTTETDIRIVNSFLLPITIVSIQTDLLNREGLKIGKMIYEQPRKIKSKSDEVLTTLSQISIITSLFQAISTLLMQDINMRSVGFARVKILWWYIDIPVDDTFIIHPKKVKIIKELTEEELKAREEERLVRAQAKEFRTVLKKQDRDLREIENAKRRYKDNYIPKEERRKNAAELIDHEAVEETNFTVELNENVIQQMADDTTTTTTEQPENTDVLQQDDVTTEIQKPTTDSDNT